MNNQANSKNLVFDLNPYYGLIRLQGKETLGFLQGLLTCDMQDIHKKNHCFGALCNLKGRVLALFRIFTYQDDFYLFLPKELIPLILPIIKKHAMFSKINFLDVSEDWSLWGYLGEMPTEANMRLTIDNHLLRVIDIFNTNDHSMTDLAKYYGPNFMQSDFETWKSFDIQAGIPEIWKQTTAKFLPHHLSLPALGAVSFSKGCYCGQEIVARMEYLGKLKYQLEKIHLALSAEISTMPEPGDELYYHHDGRLRQLPKEPDKSSEVPSHNIVTVVTAGSAQAKEIDLLVLKTADF